MHSGSTARDSFGGGQGWPSAMDRRMRGAGGLCGVQVVRVLSLPVTPGRGSGSLADGLPRLPSTSAKKLRTSVRNRSRAS